jgi:hypothetical protein
MQLEAIWRFANSHDDIRPHLSPLVGLLLAITELVEGRSSPLFKEAMKQQNKGRPRGSMIEINAKAAAAVALAHFMDLGIPKGQAAAKVARILNEKAFRSLWPQKVTARAVISWRDAGVGISDGDVDFAKAQIAKFKKAMPDIAKVEHFLRDMMATLVKWVPPNK